MVATCGFDSHGNPRLAAPDYDCRVDAQNGIWGFCPSSVIHAWDCGIAGYCVDEHDCKDGCGPLKDRSDITTFTCDGNNYCSTVISNNDFGQSYFQVGCGEVATKETIYANPPSVSATPTSSSSTIQSKSSFTTSSTQTQSQENSSSRNSQTPSTTPPPTTSAYISTNEAPTSLQLSSATSDARTDVAPNTPIPLGPIIGGAVGGISVVCLTVLAIFIIRHRNRRASSRHSSSPLRRSSFSNKYDSREEPSEAYELGAQRNQYHEASELNREPAELPGYEISRHRDDERKK